ncbi:MAG: NAD(P)-dependent alcohol dehydrogenase [Clostridiales bacterium]|nr:NAD(P)-dependent alcohol dehydrogenase [Clostridiales bacterium]
MKIEAAVLHEFKQPFSIEPVELADPVSHQVLVKIAACGICHTDEMCQAGFRTPAPAVLGHEGSGIVEKIGPDVTGIHVGDHVVLSFPSCGHCPNCQSGHNNICYDNLKLNFGGFHPDGSRPLSQNGQPLSSFFGQSSFATYAIADVSNVVVVDPDVDLRLLGPLGCGIQTGAGTVINTLKAQPGDSIVVFGTGSVGLSALMAAKASGCTTIIAVDVVDARLETARSLGATHVINSKSVNDLVAEILSIESAGVDCALDTTGIPFCIKSALGALKKGGKGAGLAVTGRMEMDAWTDLFRAKSWTHVIEGDCVPQVFIPRLIRMYKACIFPFDKIIRYFSFEGINDAFAASHDGRAIKAVVVMEKTRFLKRTQTSNRRRTADRRPAPFVCAVAARGMRRSTKRSRCRCMNMKFCGYFGH